MEKSPAKKALAELTGSPIKNERVTTRDISILFLMLIQKATDATFDLNATTHQLNTLLNALRMEQATSPSRQEREETKYTVEVLSAFLDGIQLMRTANNLGPRIRS